jgi:ornithine cyclodeaminase/alanine dehydrogenase-like protein (mu-crystallin family)
MLRDGTIRGPKRNQERAPAINGELGQLLASGHPGRSNPDEIIVVNPFGLAIEDLAIAAQVYQYATAAGLGTLLDR